MAEFKLHHHVSELIKALAVAGKINESVSLDSYAEHLRKNQTPYVTARISASSTLKNLAEHSPNEKAVLEKYEDLKVRNFRELDSVVHLLSEISSNEQVKKFLVKHAKTAEKQSHEKAAGSVPNGNTKEDEVQKLKDKLHQQVVSELSIDYKEPHKRRTIPPGLYNLPEWVQHRHNLSWDFQNEPRVDNIKIGPIDVLPPNTQEQLLIRDVLFCLAGVNTDYITAVKSDDSQSFRSFKIDQSTDESLAAMVERILPVFSYYSAIMEFIEERSNFEYGLVNHALCAAMHDIIKDYFIMIAQLEHQHLTNNLSLQKMFFYLQPTMERLKNVASIVHKMKMGDSFGGTALSVLHEKTTYLVGDPGAHDIFFHLTKSAATPYFEILEKWIYKGIISDPYSEFLVQDNELVTKDDLPTEYSDDYWEKRYTIRREQIPMFLERVADMILRSGKYLNVIRECGHDVKFANPERITYVIGEHHYHAIIETAYQSASKRLLNLLLEGNDLKGRLRSVKHYFLLDKADFIVQFMDMAEEELCKDIDDVMPTRLESLLELALRTSAVNSDKYKDDVKVELLPYDLLTQLFKILMISPADQKDQMSDLNLPITGLEAFAFDYEVKWPLSLVINRRSLACYQMLFRHLFYCKYVERLLGRIWTLNKFVKRYPLSSSSSYSAAFALHHRMMSFIQNLDYYISLEVIEPEWESFRRKILQVSNVDELMKCHNDFLDSCLTHCMLTHPELLNVLGKLIKLCMTFSKFMQRAHSHAMEAECSSMGDSLLAPVFEDLNDYGAKGDAVSSTFKLSFQQEVAQCQQQFDDEFVKLLDMISVLKSNNSSTKMADMLARFDFNEYYAKNHESVFSRSYERAQNRNSS